jgi:two-component system KDP operon response regulator KdpE
MTPVPKHILIAEDDPVTVQMLSGVLEGSGFDVAVAVDAMQAVMMAMRRPPDAVILDIGMPAGGGFQVLERLNAAVKTSAIPVIVITAQTDPALQARVRALGAKEFFSKPVAPDQLRQALDRLLAPSGDAPPPA